MTEREALTCLRALGFKVVLKGDRPLIPPHPDEKEPPQELTDILKANRPAVLTILREEKGDGAKQAGVIGANGATPVVTPFTTISVAAMDEQQFPETKFAVDGLIPANGLTLVAAREKSGKSLWTIDMGLSIATGESFLDRATRQMTVAYCVMEDPFNVVRDRVRTRLDKERDVPFHIVPLDGTLDQSFRLDDDGTGLRRLIATLDACDAGVLILDPLRETHSGRENMSDDMIPIMRQLRVLAHGRPITIIVPHHMNKSTVDALSSVRGSTAITGSVDQVLTLSVNSDDDEFTPASTVTLRTVGRYGPRQRIVARLGTGLRWTVTDATAPDRTLPGRIITLLVQRDDVLDADAITVALEANRGTVQNALREMCERGTIVRLGKGTKAAPFGYAPPSANKEVTKDDE
jgi:hypothetical protein